MRRDSMPYSEYSIIIMLTLNECHAPCLCWCNVPNGARKGIEYFDSILCSLLFFVWVRGVGFAPFRLASVLLSFIICSRWRIIRRNYPLSFLLLLLFSFLCLSFCFVYFFFNFCLSCSLIAACTGAPSKLLRFLSCADLNWNSLVSFFFFIQSRKNPGRVTTTISLGYPHLTFVIGMHRAIGQRFDIIRMCEWYTPARCVMDVNCKYINWFHFGERGVLFHPLFNRVVQSESSLLHQAPNE